MALEPTVDYVDDLDPTSPEPADPKSQGDDHIRNLKKALKQSFPNIAGVMPVAHDQVASKSDIAQAQFQTALPVQPGGPVEYDLVSQDGQVSYMDRLADLHAAALSF